MGQDKSEQIGIFGQRLEQARERLGFSVKEFSEQLGIPYRSYMNYKSGRTPPADLLAKVIELFAVNPAWLMTGIGKPFLNSEAWDRYTGYEESSEAFGEDDEGDFEEALPDEDRLDEDDEEFDETFDDELDDESLKALIPRASRKDGAAKLPATTESDDPQLRLMTHLVTLHEENRDLRQRVEELEETLTRAVVRRRKARRRSTF